MQFTAKMGDLEGPALIERADGRVEVGNYLNNMQDGPWKYKYVDGSSETTLFTKGKPEKKAMSTKGSNKVKQNNYVKET